jgi:quercetin dioxygenase-like cupin family protein
MPTSNQQLSSASLTLTTEELSAIADGIAAGDPGAFVPSGTDRRWGIVVATEAYEAWVIAWPSGTGLAMHDHGGARAAVRVVSGRLRERFHAGGAVQLRWLDAGQAQVLSADHVHEVINLNDTEAITVHVYSPPVGDMGFRVDPEIDLRTTPST